MTSVRLTVPIAAAGETARACSWPGSLFNSARTAEASSTGSFTFRLAFASPILGEFRNKACRLGHEAADDRLRAGDGGMDGYDTIS